MRLKQDEYDFSREFFGNKGIEGQKKLRILKLASDVLREFSALPVDRDALVLTSKSLEKVFTLGIHSWSFIQTNLAVAARDHGLPSPAIWRLIWWLSGYSVAPEEAGAFVADNNLRQSAKRLQFLFIKISEVTQDLQQGIPVDSVAKKYNIGRDLVERTAQLLNLRGAVAIARLEMESDFDVFAKEIIRQDPDGTYTAWENWAPNAAGAAVRQEEHYYTKGEAVEAARGVIAQYKLADLKGIDNFPALYAYLRALRTIQGSRGEEAAAKVIQLIENVRSQPWDYDMSSITNASGTLAEGLREKVRDLLSAHQTERDAAGREHLTSDYVAYLIQLGKGKIYAAKHRGQPTPSILAEVLPKVPEGSNVRRAIEDLKGTLEVNRNTLSANYSLTEEEIRLVFFVLQPGQGAGDTQEEQPSPQAPAGVELPAAAGTPGDSLWAKYGDRLKNPEQQGVKGFTLTNSTPEEERRGVIGRVAEVVAGGTGTILSQRGAFNCNYIVIYDTKNRKAALIHTDNLSSEAFAKTVIQEAAAEVGIDLSNPANVVAFIARPPEQFAGTDAAAKTELLQSKVIADLHLARINTSVDLAWGENEIRFLVDEGVLLALSGDLNRIKLIVDLNRETENEAPPAAARPRPEAEGVLRSESDEGRPGTQGQGLGGIDLRAMTIVRQPVSLGSIPQSKNGIASVPLASLGVPRNDNHQAISASLEKEWEQIQNMLGAGIIPSNQRIKEYLISICNEKDCVQEIDKVLSCLADVFRLEEERCSDTDAPLKEILVLLESNQPAAELQLALAKIKIEEKEPVLIEE